MYRYIILVLVVTVGLFANINSIKTQQKSIKYVDIKTALKESKKDHKIILIKATSKNCHYCKKMDREVLSSLDIKEILNREFILVSIDVSNQELPFGLECHMTPTFFFITEDEKLFKTIPGSWNKEDFLDILNEINKSKKLNKNGE